MNFVFISKSFYIRFNLPAFLIIGIDQHGKNRLFAFGLLQSESIDDFVWVLKEFNNIMKGLKPKLIFTD